jgi:Nickel responsive protein SCO4226-like
MSEYLVEAYVSRVAAGAAPGFEDLSLAADELTREGKQVRFLRSIFVPEDETCFYLYQAPSIDAVREAAARAGLDYERVTEAVSNGFRQPA